MYWVGRWEGGSVLDGLVGGSVLDGSLEVRSVLCGSVGGRVCTEWVGRREGSVLGGSVGGRVCTGWVIGRVCGGCVGGSVGLYWMVR